VPTYFEPLNIYIEHHILTTHTQTSTNVMQSYIINPIQGHRGQGAWGLWSPNFFEIIRFSEILMFRWKIFGLAVGKDKGFEFYRNIFELDTSLYSTGATTLM